MFFCACHIPWINYLATYHGISNAGDIYVGNEGTKYIPGQYNTIACADNARLNRQSCNEAALVLGQGEKAKIAYERNCPEGCMMYRGNIYYNNFYGQADDSSTPFCEYSKFGLFHFRY